MDTTRSLRAVDASEPGPLDEPDAARGTEECSAEEYWARVQQLRADLARLGRV